MNPPWLDLARQHVGIKEVPGSGDNDTILKWMPYSGLDESYWHDSTAWCKIFVNAMLEESGYKSDRNAMARAAMSFGQSCEPKPGALMVMPRGRPPSGHIGIVEKVDGAYVETIEGNVSNAVVRKRRRASSALKNGFRWPVETLGQAPQVSVTAPPDSERFTACLAETLKWEGNWSNDPYDTGGATMKGVIQRVYNAYRKRKGRAQRSVRLIDDDELKEIYKTQYWNNVEGFNMPPGLDLAVFDFGVNSGPYRSITKLQGVLGLSQDGLVGPITEEAIGGCDVAATIKSLCNARRAFVRQIKTYWRFGKGWERRIAGIEQAALEAVGIKEDIPDLPLPKPDEDAQSASQGRAEEEKVPLNPKVAIGVATTATGAVSSALSTPSPVSTPAADTITNLPVPPQQTIEAVTAWNSFSSIVRDTAEMGINHWPYVLVAVGLYIGIVYGLPMLYRRAQ